MPRALPVVLVLAVLSLVIAIPAHAVLITVNFTVSGSPSDPENAGKTVNGSFSFDSVITPVGGGTVSDPSLTSIDFSWDDKAWTDANASVEGLVFDPSGNVTGWLLGGDIGGVSGLVLVSQGVPVDDFRLSATPSASSFSYHIDTVNTPIYTTVFSWSVSTGSAPEPASWLLLGGALVGLVGVRRRIGK